MTKKLKQRTQNGHGTDHIFLKTDIRRYYGTIKSIAMPKLRRGTKRQKGNGEAQQSTAFLINEAKPATTDLS